ncbi:DUF6443 domain-containing protein, partial [Mucilaginibacter sp. RCC_168]|uniref:DUF6443 domain-containing protein n=1 Tax=Mucilaginibacter sp. RCC_168 TaxID=3239221 RepID=UPI003526796B
MKIINRLLAAFSLLFIVYSSKAQTPIQVTAPMTGTPAAGSYFSYSSITLSPNFSFTAAPGSSLSLYIANSDCQPLGTALSQNQNYILSSVPRKAGYNPAVNTYSTCDLMQTVQYFDGLGRPLQTVQVKGSPANKDVVQPFVYDQFGREATKYLPYAATTVDGSYKTDALTTGVNNFYNPTGSGISGTQQSNGIVVIPQPFAQTNFEPSPLNRVLEQGAPGTDWQPVANSTAGHTRKIVYTTNNEKVITDTANTMLVALYTVTINADQSRTLGRNGNYGAGQLYVTVSKDENWKDTGFGNSRGGTTEEYKDKEGHVVLKRTFNYTGSALQMLSTYYVYDDLGNLAFVLPPGSNADNVLPTSTTQDNLCYQYRYDGRNRQIEKKIPGKGWEYMVYNKLDQVVATQDGVQRAKSTQEWSFTKYDQFGRIAYSGVYQYPGSTAGTSYRAALQITVDGQTTLWETQQTTGTGYSGTAWPQANILRYLVLNYYDNYTYPNNPYTPTVSGTLTNPTGLLTATKTAVLLPDGTYGSMLWTAYFYDSKGRAVQTDKQHYLGGEAGLNTLNYDEISNSYNFTDQVTSTTRHHYVANVQSLLVTTNYQYDHMGRKVQTSEAISTGTSLAPAPTIISQLDYNEIGQLKTKHLHSINNGGSYLQDISYIYNERGWLSQINDPSVAPSANKLFSEKLNYNVPQFGAPAQFNSNIAEQQYNAGISGNQHVTYSYDQLNRLKSGTSSTGYSETISNYDNLGNIQGLTRTAPNAATLTYNYTGNQLQTITNNGAAFRSYPAYDLNGNASSDGQGNVILYNMIDLPRSIASKNLSYTYSATGEKLRKNSNGSITEYIEGIQYRPDGTIDFVQTEEGRANRSGTNYVYEYTLTDHLGNNRVTFDQTNGKVGEDDYYPFGLNVHRQVNGGNKYLYNKKELQEELNQYDYGARFYDPVIGRFTTVDPLAEVDR